MHDFLNMVMLFILIMSLFVLVGNVYVYTGHMYTCRDSGVYGADCVFIT